MKVKFSFLIFLLTGLVTGLSAQNLLENGGFENGYEGWGGYGGELSSFAGEGDFSLHFYDGMAEQVIYDLDTSLTYKVSCRIYISPQFSGSDWGGINLGIISYDWQLITQIAEITPNNHQAGNWFRVIAAFKTFSENIRLRVGFFGGQGWNPDFYADDVRLFVKPGENDPPVIEAIHFNAIEGAAPFQLQADIVAGDGFYGAVVQTMAASGEGGIIEGNPINITYFIPGIYEFTAYAIDDEGAMATAGQTITVLGSSGHSIQITQPTSEPFYQTSESSVSIGGSRQGGAGSVFWINTRTLQNGWTAAGDLFQLPAVKLLPGENIIHTQSCAADSTCLIDEIKVNYLPPDYAGPVISGFVPVKNEVDKYEKWECRFDVLTTADNPSFPCDPARPVNTHSGDGISVYVVFTNGITVLKMPAFLDAETVEYDNGLRATGNSIWKVRMAFRDTGIWSTSFQARDSYGYTEIIGPQVMVMSDTSNPGFIKVSAADNRYFEFDNGRLFTGMGSGSPLSDHLAEMNETLQTFSSNGMNFSRVWLMDQSPFSDAWCSWATHHEMSNNGYMPPPLYSISQHYKNGDYSWRIASPAIPGQNTPAMFRGFWDQPTLVKPSTSYRIVARVKTVNLEGNGGMVIKTGGWLGQEAVNPGTGVVISPFLKRNNNWVYLVGSYTTSAGETRFPNLYLVLQAGITGEAYIDQVTIQEVLAGGELSGNILAKPSANVHYYLDGIECRYFDYLFEKSTLHQYYYKVPILEKNDWILNHIEPLTGLVTLNNGRFDPPKGSKLHRLYEYYWRNLIARWGYSTSVHSWELVNEGAPGSYKDLMNDMAEYFDANCPYPRMTSTSFWAGWEPGYWAASGADYADIHAYIMTTGWIDEYEIDGVVYSREDLKNDAAAAIFAYSDFVWKDPLRNKPVILAETDLDMPGNQSPDPLLVLDTAGVWLHNFNWGHINHGGLTGIIWNNTNIVNNHLYHRYKGFRAFMKNIPLNNGLYVPLKKTVNNSQLRVWGQQQADGRTAHFWVQNSNHTWKRVVQSGNPAPESGEIRIHGINPGPVEVEFWDSWNEAESPWQSVVKTVSSDSILYLPIHDLVTDMAFKVRSLVQAQEQTITLSPGWSGISSYLSPAVDALADIFGTIPGFEILMQPPLMYWPGGQIETLTSWSGGSAYIIRMNAPDSLTLSGTPVPESVVSLPAGWSVLPVISTCTVSAETIFMQNPDHIQIILEIAGNRLWWPEGGIATLPGLLPGKAYYIRVSEPIEIVFPDCR